MARSRSPGSSTCWRRGRLGRRVGPPAPGPRVLGLPYARRTARVPAGGDRPRHRAARRARGGRRTVARRPARHRVHAAATGQPGVAGRRRHRHRAARDLGGGAARRPALSLLGFRSGEYAEAAALLPGDVLVATDDGSGPDVHHGLVTDLLERELAATGRRLRVRAAPDARGGQADLRRTGRRGAARAGGRHGVRLRRLLRLRRATRTGFRRLCVDGPVVRAADLEEDWH